MSVEQSREDTPSQREKNLSIKLEKAELALQANSQREAELLTELLRAKATLLDESQQREHRLSAQLEQTSADLDASQKREQQTLTLFEKLTSDFEALKKSADDPSSEILEKEAALVASRQQERQLSMELQSVKNELSSCKDSRKPIERELADTKKDLERSRNSATEQSARLDEANKKIRELSKEAEQSKQKISEMSKASEQAGRSYQSLWSRYNRLQESNKNNRYYQQSTYHWPPLQAPSQSFRFDDQPRNVNPIFDFNLGANRQGSQVNVAQRFGTQSHSTATFGAVSAIQPGGSRSFSHNGSSQSKYSFNGFRPATLKLSNPPNGPGIQKRQQDNQIQQGAADPKRLKKET